MEVSSSLAPAHPQTNDESTTLSSWRAEEGVVHGGGAPNDDDFVDEKAENLLSSLRIDSDGWVSVVASHDAQEQEGGGALLLRSCRVLLNRLEKPREDEEEDNHDDDDEADDGGSVEDGGGEVQEEAAEADAAGSKKVADESERVVVDLTGEEPVVVGTGVPPPGTFVGLPLEEGQETEGQAGWDSQDGGGEEADAAAGKAEASTMAAAEEGDEEDEEEEEEEVDPETVRIQSLSRVTNLYDLCQSALNDIEKLASSHVAHPPRTHLPGHNLGRRGRRKYYRVLQLQAEQEAKLEKMRKEQNGEDVELSAGTNKWADGDEDADSAWTGAAAKRIAMALNSLRTLLPVLLPMLRHTRSRDRNLLMSDGGKLRYEGKKKQCFLLGEHVYDVCTVNGSSALMRQLERIVRAVAAVGVLGDGMDAPTYGRDLVIPRALGCKCGTVEEVVEETLGWFFSDEQRTQGGGGIARTLLEADARYIAPLLQSNPELQSLHQRAIQTLHSCLSHAIQYRHRDATLTIYGSCLSDLTLGHSSDVDISIHIPAAYDLKRQFADGSISANKFESEMKSYVYRVSRVIGNYRGGSQFVDVEAVARARVPVVKGRYLYAKNPFSDDGSINFDICFLNDIAVANSSLLREYSNLDRRVKLLMLAVKAWAKGQRLNSAADGTLSSYSWMNLVVFFLQCIDFVPNLQCPAFLATHGAVPDPEGNYWHSVNDLETAYLTCDEVTSRGLWVQPERFRQLPVTALLCGFFTFYSSVFPHCIASASIRLGRCALLKTAFAKARLERMSIEDPFETHESYCPHDLGAHLTDSGQVRFRRSLKQAAESMRGWLSLSTREETIQNLIKLWPTWHSDTADIPVPAFIPEQNVGHARNVHSNEQGYRAENPNRMNPNRRKKAQQQRYFNPQQQQQQSFGNQSQHYHPQPHGNPRQHYQEPAPAPFPHHDPNAHRQQVQQQQYVGRNVKVFYNNPQHNSGPQPHTDQQHTRQYDGDHRRGHDHVGRGSGGRYQPHQKPHSNRRTNSGGQGQHSKDERHDGRSVPSATSSGRGSQNPGGRGGGRGLKHEPRNQGSRSHGGRGGRHGRHGGRGGHHSGRGRGRSDRGRESGRGGGGRRE